MIILTFLIFINIRLTAPTVKEFTILRNEPLFDKNVLSWHSIDYWINYYQVKEPEIVKRQIRLETRNLQSRFCRQYNNLFGMNKARKRQTTAIGRDKSMAVYKDFKDSILDYKIWQDYFYENGDYYLFLKSHGYATDPHYIDKLIAMK